MSASPLLLLLLACLVNLLAWIRSAQYNCVNTFDNLKQNLFMGITRTVTCLLHKDRCSHPVLLRSTSPSPIQSITNSPAPSELQPMSPEPSDSGKSKMIQLDFELGSGLRMEHQNDQNHQIILIVADACVLSVSLSCHAHILLACMNISVYLSCHIRQQERASAAGHNRFKIYRNSKTVQVYNDRVILRKKLQKGFVYEEEYIERKMLENQKEPVFNPCILNQREPRTRGGTFCFRAW